MSKIIVSGLVNVETNMKVEGFPIKYSPMSYPFFGIETSVSGVGYNLTKALTKLGDDVTILSFVGKDEEGQRISRELEQIGVNPSFVLKELDKTPQSVILYENSGRRQGYCDLKDIQEHVYPVEQLEESLKECQLVCACNINYSRTLLKMAKEKEIMIATDVHVLEQIDDSYNKEFMDYADILFLSDEKIPCTPMEFIIRLKNEYPCKIIVIGLGSEGAMLYSKMENALYKIDAVSVENVVNTVGAGDALFSTFVHYFMKGKSPIEALKYAECFAAYKIGATGGASGFISEDELETIYAKTVFSIHKL